MVSNDRNDDSSYKNKLANLSDLFFRSSDAYNNIVADNTVHKVDIPSTYPFSSERLEYIENGALTDFASSTKTVDDPAKWVLNADAGDVLTIRSRQRVRYTPGYESEYGISFHVLNDLPDGAKVIVEQGNGQNSFRSVYTNNSSELQLIRDSTVQETVSFENPVPLTQPQIDKGRVNMYGVGSFILLKSYIDSDFQDRFEEAARIGDLNHVSVDNFNLKLKITIDCSEASEGATLHALSMQSKQRGNASRIDREKQFIKFGLGGSIEDTEWTPVLALRKNNDKENITVDVSSVTAIPTARMKVVAFAVNEADTDATGFATPEESNPENDVVEITEDVTTPSSPTNNGRQSLEVLANADNRNSATISETNTITPIYDDDVIVFLAKTKSGTGHSVDLLVKTAQAW